MSTKIDTSKLDEAKRKHRNNPHANRWSNAEDFKTDILKFINDNKNKTPSKYFIVTIVKKHNNKIYWHIDEPESLREMQKEARSNNDNIIFYHVNNWSIHEINKKDLK